MDNQAKGLTGHRGLQDSVLKPLICLFLQFWAKKWMSCHHKTPSFCCFSCWPELFGSPPNKVLTGGKQTPEFLTSYVSDPHICCRGLQGAYAMNPHLSSCSKHCVELQAPLFSLPTPPANRFIPFISPLVLSSVVPVTRSSLLTAANLQWSGCGSENQCCWKSVQILTKKI